MESVFRSLVFVDNLVLNGSSQHDLDFSLEQFAADCEAAGVRISTSKSEPAQGRVPLPAPRGGVKVSESCA